MSNLDRLKHAYKSWHESKGTVSKPWFDLLADQVELQSMGNESKALAFGAPRRSKEEVVQYFEGLASNWSMLHWSPHTYVTEGDTIAVFSRCAWTSKETGKSVETPTAHLWRFEDGKVTSMIEIFDSARVLAAATP